jgi:glycine cleavage system H protein
VRTGLLGTGTCQAVAIGYTLDGMGAPKQLRYTREHAWISVDSSVATIGVTHVVADTLSDIVSIQLPEVGGSITEGEMCGELGTIRAVFDLLAPVTGQVVAANNAVLTSPSAVGSNAYAAWLYMVALAGDGNPADLLTAAEYDAYAAN